MNIMNIARILPVEHNEDIVIRSQVYSVIDDLVDQVVIESGDLDVNYDFDSDDLSLTTDVGSDDDLSLTVDDRSNFLTDRDVVRVLFSDEGEPIGEISRERNIDAELPVYCDVCNCDESEIHSRIETENGPVDVLNYLDAGGGQGIRSCVCTSCSIFMDEGSRCCISCGLNENLGRQYGISFFQCESPDDICCIHCEDYYPDLYHNQEIYDNVNTSNIYQGEYENEELPENNTEKVKSIKETVSDIGEMIFDLQEKFTEGEYLKMMNLLQSATNGLNSL